MSRSTAALIMLALMILPARMERAMADTIVTQRMLQVAHVRIEFEQKIRRSRGGARTCRSRRSIPR